MSKNRKTIIKSITGGVILTVCALSVPQVAFAATPTKGINQVINVNDEGVVVAGQNESLYLQESVAKPSVSDRGNIVAFTTKAAIDTKDTNNDYDVYLRNVETNKTVLVTASSDGLSAGDGFSWKPALSDDGTKVAFVTFATNLDDTIIPSTGNVVMKDLNTNEVTLISSLPDGTAAGNVNDIAFSGDGNVVAYSTSTENIIDNVTDIPNTYDVYTKNIFLDETKLISHSAEDPNATATGDYTQPSLSADGSVVSYTGTGFNSTDPAQIFASQNGTIRLVSSVDGLAYGDGGSAFSDVSGQGNEIVFASEAKNLKGGQGNKNVFVKNLTNEALELINIAEDGTNANASDEEFQIATISADGTKVAFNSPAGNLDTKIGPAPEGATIGNVYVRDRAKGVTSTMSVNTENANSTGSAYDSAISADGNFVAFPADTKALTTTNLTENVSNFFLRSTEPVAVEAAPTPIPEETETPVVPVPEPIVPQENVTENTSESVDDRNCSAFATQEEAQKSADAGNGDLDRDNDGIACENLPQGELAETGNTTNSIITFGTAAFLMLAGVGTALFTRKSILN